MFFWRWLSFFYSTNSIWLQEGKRKYIQSSQKTILFIEQQWSNLLSLNGNFSLSEVPSWRCDFRLVINAHLSLSLSFSVKMNYRFSSSYLSDRFVSSFSSLSDRFVRERMNNKSNIISSRTRLSREDFTSSCWFKLFSISFLPWHSLKQWFVLEFLMILNLSKEFFQFICPI